MKCLLLLILLNTMSIFSQDQVKLQIPDYYEDYHNHPECYKITYKFEKLCWKTELEPIQKPISVITHICQDINLYPEEIQRLIAEAHTNTIEEARDYFVNFQFQKDHFVSVSINNVKKAVETNRTNLLNQYNHPPYTHETIEQATFNINSSAEIFLNICIQNHIEHLEDIEKKYKQKAQILIKYINQYT